MSTTLPSSQAPVSNEPAAAEPDHSPPPGGEGPLPDSGCYSARGVGRQDRYEDWTMQLWEIERDHA